MLLVLIDHGVQMRLWLQSDFILKINSTVAQCLATKRPTFHSLVYILKIQEAYSTCPSEYKDFNHTAILLKALADEAPGETFFLKNQSIQNSITKFDSP